MKRLYFPPPPRTGRQFAKGLKTSLIALTANALLMMSSSLNVVAQAPLWGFPGAGLDPSTGTTNGYGGFNSYLYNPPTGLYYGYGSGSTPVELPSGNQLWYSSDPNSSATLFEASLRAPFIIPNACRQYYSYYNLQVDPNRNQATFISKWSYSEVPGQPGLVDIKQISKAELFPSASGYGRGGYVLVDGLQPNGSRYLYGITTNSSPGGFSVLRYTISASGSLSGYTDLGEIVANGSNETIVPYMKPELSADGKSIFIATIRTGTNYANFITRFDIPTQTATKVVNVATGNFTGMEWVPGSAFGTGASPRLYVSWYSTASGVTGGIYYYNLNSTPAGGYTSLGTNALGSTPNQARFGFTDLERSANNQLYFAEDPNPNSIVWYNNISSTGNLWKLNAATGAVSAVGVNVTNVASYRAYQIQDQIDGEDYSKYSYAVETPQFTLNGVTQTGAAIPTVDVCTVGGSLILNRTGSFTNTWTVTIEKGNISGTNFTLGGNPITSSPQNGSINSINLAAISTTFYNYLLNYNGGLQVTVSATNNCSGNTTATKTQRFNIRQSTLTVDFGMWGKFCPNGGIVKPRTTTLPIPNFTFNNTGSTISAQQQQLCDAVGVPRSYQGANSVGIDGINLPASNWEINVYEVDPNTGNALLSFPVGYIVNMTGVNSAPPGFVAFNTNTTFPANPNYPPDYFKNLYADALTLSRNTSSTAPLTALSQRVWKVEMKASLPTSACPQKIAFSYFRLAVSTNTSTTNYGQYWKRAPQNGSDSSEDNSVIDSKIIRPIYPNPTTGLFMLDNGYFQSGNAVVLRISDVTGREVFNTSLLANRQIDVQHLPSGLYVYYIAANGQSYTGKLVKE